MSEDKNKIGAMFEKALANRASKANEEKQEEQSNNIETKKESTIEENIVEEQEESIEKVQEEANEENVNEFNNEFNDEIEEEADGLEEYSEEQNNKAIMIKIEELEDFPDQPFKMYSEEKERDMIDSIKVNGIIQDLIVRPLENGKYQILSGHNRKNCAKKAGLKEVPCKIKTVDDDMAKLMLVDTNLIQRKDFYPSETAKALQIKKQIYRKKAVKSDFFNEISKEQNMSRGNIQRYLRLNYLIPELVDRVDTKEITLKIAEDISFLTKKEQKKLEEMLEAKPRKLTSNQAKRLKEESDKNNLSEELLRNILADSENATNKDLEIKFTKDEIEKYFKNFDNANEIKKFIISMLNEKETTSQEKSEIND